MEGDYQGDPMVALAGALMAVGDSAKDLHYSAMGRAFYGLHLMADRIAEPIYGFCDKIKELAFADSDVPPSFSFVEAERAVLEEGRGGNEDSLAQLSSALGKAEQALGAARSDGGEGLNQLFDGIAEHLLTSMFLVNRSMKDDGEGEASEPEEPPEAGSEEEAPQPAEEAGGEGGEPSPTEGEGGGAGPGVGALKGMLGGHA